MKKSIYLAAALLFSLGFVACEENEEDFTTVETVDRLAGTWELTKIGGLNANNSLNYVNVPVNPDCQRDKYIFGTDSAFTINDYTFEDNTCVHVASTGVYTIENGTLILSIGDVVIDTYSILTNSDTTLELIDSDPETGELTFLRYTKQVPVPAT